MRNGISFDVKWKYFILFFCYSIALAVIFQKFILSFLPSLHAVNGLLPGDAQYFNEVAVKLANQIISNGWGAWKFYPAYGATGNTSLLAAFYAALGFDPAWMILINALLHAAGGILIVRISALIMPGNIGARAGIIAATFFVVFPSSLNWYGQIHKDGFSIFSTLLFLNVWLKSDDLNNTGWLFVFEFFAAVFLSVMVRPYHLYFVLIGFATMFLFEILCEAVKYVCHGGFACKRMTLKLLLMAGIALAIQVAPKGDQMGYSGWNGGFFAGNNLSETPWEWQPTSFIPSKLDKFMEIVAKTRAGMINNALQANASSMIDVDVRPNNFVDVILYLPRAVQIAMFAPFPSKWFEKNGALRYVAVAETLIWYLLAPGVLFLLSAGFNKKLIGLLIFSLSCMAVLGFTIANVGSLYRVRYVFLFVFIMAGVIGWQQFFDLHKNKMACVRLRESVRWIGAAVPFALMGLLVVAMGCAIYSGSLASIIACVVGFVSLGLVVWFDRRGMGVYGNSEQK